MILPCHVLNVQDVRLNWNSCRSQRVASTLFGTGQRDDPPNVLAGCHSGPLLKSKTWRARSPSQRSVDRLGATIFAACLLEEGDPVESPVRLGYGLGFVDEKKRNVRNHDVCQDKPSRWLLWQNVL